MPSHAGAGAWPVAQSRTDMLRYNSTTNAVATIHFLLDLAEFGRLIESAALAVTSAVEPLYVTQ